ncbi:phosphopantothenoylcysteine decarboxylase [Pelotomaculum schinkii]|uniref:Phosphopantothenoylcysteine decarboxylase n=1 Tax=Pelotomaculum schinkii TaxID=78350 RepID=A0A4Y7R9F5_9FIRM|nr:flavoprotein [Pelotomaculum schinkii]TEB05412.1 phosphopantothenoylcysteine decarboxylase [Pelotomaculum schinkii]
MNYSKETVELIVREVLKQLGEVPSKPDGLKLLVLFSGGKLGADEALAQLKELRASGYQITAAFTPSAKRVLGIDWFSSVLPDSEIVTESDVLSPLDFVKDADMIAVPVLTLNTAAKVAFGIADNLMTTLFMQGLLQGKPIIAAKDACDVNHPMCPKSLKSSQVYVNRLQENCKILEKYGVLLVNAADLSREVNQCARQDVRYSANAYLKQQNTDTTIFSERVLSMGSVAEWEGKVLRVSKGTLITSAARDLAYERGIEIVRP